MLTKRRLPNDDIERLSTLKSYASAFQSNQIDDEIRNIQYGEKAEKDAAYHIDHAFGGSDNWAVIHDLRIVAGGFPAQIDHILINRLLDVYVLESKSFTQGLKITENGDFLRYHNGRSKGMPSPIEQNKKHITTLERLFNEHDIAPKRMGMTLSPRFRSLILVTASSRIDRPDPKRFDTSSVIKADGIKSRLDADFEKNGPLQLMRAIGTDSLKEIADKLASLHTPKIFDYAAKFSINLPDPGTTPPDLSLSVTDANDLQRASSARCKSCQGSSLEIKYGFNYFGNCLDCGTATKIELPGPGRLKKKGSKFFHVHPDESETLFFENA